MTAEELETLFRVQTDDVVLDYLVSEESFLEYLNEAQQEACIRSKLLFDRSSSITRLSTLTGVDSYVIDDSIYTIKEAFITAANETTRLFIVDSIELDRLCPEWRQETGVPKYLIPYDDHIELSPKPGDAYEIKLECYLVPDEISDTSMESELQIKKIHHRKLLHWVKHKSYETQDNDILDKNKSLEELAKFERAFGFRPTAKYMKKQYANIPKRNKVCL